MKILFFLIAALTLTPIFSSGLALIAGICFALIFGNPFLSHTRRITHLLLQVSVVGLGASMDLRIVGRVGFHGLVYTVIGIILTLVLGRGLGEWLKIKKDTSLLLSVGTAICGGSAIAAVASTIRAKESDISVSLATVFLLNAVALLLFPWIGHQVGLSETQFGLWSALAIHDTSSVVGASLQYGPQALMIATTTKLARALWIIPVSLMIGFFYNSKKKDLDGDSLPAKRPWFILGFLAAAALVTWIPSLQPIGQSVAVLAKRSLVLTLFLIGSGLSKRTLQSVGLRPFIQGGLLWVMVGAGTLLAVCGNRI